MSELSLHNLKVNKKAKKKAKRVGRGNSSGSGTYSGRGLKGQRSRSGGKGGLKRRGLKQMLKSKPKVGGFKSFKPRMVTVNIDQLENIFTTGDLVNSKKLIAKNLIKTAKTGVKILGNGKLSKKLNVVANNFSETAKKAIIDAGGTAKLISRQPSKKTKAKIKKS
ncbi:MAG: 50S ribosomal protein L15 [Parcubacteria group bacterium]|nr:50S ribosomal protein L15 [Parcubacteria group bacterium]|tara:strand:- start:16623 stop:17117 length:495 start_codon:yes stop_codon:yes gene_type:complete